MIERELSRTGEMCTEVSPITALCIVADKNKAPNGFQPILKAHDDSSDADLWRESSFSIWSRPVRYLCISRDTPKTGIQAPISVVTDLLVVKESEPIPYGFVALDYTADSREKALRKKFICVRQVPRDTAVDAVGEIIVLNKKGKTPKEFTSAGEVDGILICFRVVVIPPSFGLTQSSSDQALTSTFGAPPPIGLYPNISNAHSTPALSNAANQKASLPINAFTIKQSVVGPKAIDGVPFKLNARLQGMSISQCSGLPLFPEFDISRLDTEEFNYSFQLERSTLASMC